MDGSGAARSLRQLISALSDLRGVIGDPDIQIAGIAYDSRRVQPGELFVAVPGFKTDGHQFIPEAIRRGAAAVVASKPEFARDLPVPAVVVGDSRLAMAELAAAFYDWPSRRLVVVGVTGTNGKTTVALMMQRAAEAIGLRAAALGTLGLYYRGAFTETDRTTLEAPDLQRQMSWLADDGADFVSMEVSSHGLVLHRVWQTFFDAAILTNITQDHLDFHESMDDYVAAKRMLFVECARLSIEAGKQFVAAINVDDARGREIAEAAAGDVVTYGIKGGMIRAEAIELGEDGTSFVVSTPEGKIRARLALVGEHNVYNALAAMAVAWKWSWPLEAVAGALAELPAIPGRLERVDRGQPFLVLVDYAHTPDALERVLASVRRVVGGRVICVFGCGGDRDRGKRPKMGAIATRLADWTVITSDNPRSEEPEAIIRDIVQGAERGRYEVVLERAEAIRRAIELAGPGDAVLIAGKGHETYQIFADRTIHFDDREVAARALEELGYSAEASNV